MAKAAKKPGDPNYTPPPPPGDSSWDPAKHGRGEWGEKKVTRRKKKEA